MTSQSRGLLLAFAGVLIITPDTLLVRLMHLDTWPLLFYRGMGMAAGVAVYTLMRGRQNLIQRIRALGLIGVATAVCFSTANMLFVNSLMRTSVANTLAIISTAPIWAAFFSALVLRERLPLRTWAAVVLTAGCIIVIVGGGLGGSGSSPTGDIIALFQAVFMAAGFVLIRSQPDVEMVPCMILGGSITAIVSFLNAGSLAVAMPDVVPLVLLVLVVLPGSFLCLLNAPRFIPAPEVNMILLLEMVLGPLLVWTAVGETVPIATFIGGTGLFAVLLGHSYLGMRAYGKKRIVPIRVGEASVSSGK
ncbi:EamA/RhaT family transporter [Oceanidesulfovibrio indonesiensis]|uniref:EamA/RhaT family transporter n=1 Tax=Oceanidesulfovibrio indonesiensis TaxID=54767 RepID=A0A7M3MBN0_9BACT|nr:DMT family transporter [Oceanidesulfovibrio indonesiensis]TVM15631.1 EamA/RhaT family transporter [Oceanidesulfovibrio indonesiensis]